MNSVETDIYRVSDVKLFFFWIAFFGTFANKFGYSEVPKKNVTFLILFSYPHGLIRTYKFLCFWEKFPPTV